MLSLLGCRAAWSTGTQLLLIFPYEVGSPFSWPAYWYFAISVPICIHISCNKNDLNYIQYFRSHQALYACTVSLITSPAQMPVRFYVCISLSCCCIAFVVHSHSAFSLPCSVQSVQNNRLFWLLKPSYFYLLAHYIFFFSWVSNLAPYCSCVSNLSSNFSSVFLLFVPDSSVKTWN